MSLGPQVQRQRRRRQRWRCYDGGGDDSDGVEAAQRQSMFVVVAPCLRVRTNALLIPVRTHALIMPVKTHALLIPVKTHALLYL